MLMKRPNSSTRCGLLYPRMAFPFSGSIFSPSPLTICPKYFTSFHPTFDFDPFNETLYLRKIEKTFRKCSRCSSNVCERHKCHRNKHCKTPSILPTPSSLPHCSTLVHSSIPAELVCTQTGPCDN